MESSDSNVKDELENGDVGVKSSAIVKYDAIKTPTTFAKLQNNTNLNLPPPNWLRRGSYFDERWFESLRGHWAFPARSSNSYFTSFRMANVYPDCVGDVDVISDADNIKRLLKIPFNNGNISMIVHRIGKTLLIDHFDIHSHILRTSQSEWHWLRKFYFEEVLREFQENKILDKADKSRDYLHNKSLFSKFLHYSVAENMTRVESVNNEESEREKVKKTWSERKKALPTFVPRVRDPFEFNFTIKEEEEEEMAKHFKTDIPGHQRDVIWTFEDIQMLIGSDMPIFGGGTHPAVSLRLSDMAKPISVLTGLDYWLDNLMCNVPEVIMCYHLDGIVKKYERMKTKDIPNLENSKFSPRVVKDVAENILSFLKSKTTKCGHTYWLFKGKNDEAIKLYDLTTLCNDIAEYPDQNPYSLPVAMLLFRVASNIHEHKKMQKKKEQEPLTCFYKATVHKLLKQCLSLIDQEKHKKIAISANHLMSEIYLPLSSQPLNFEAELQAKDELSTTFNTTPNYKHSREKNAYITFLDHPKIKIVPTSDFGSDEEGDDPQSSDNEFRNAASVQVSKLSTTSQFIRNELDEVKQSIPPVLAGQDWAERSLEAINYLNQGLKLIEEIDASSYRQCTSSAFSSKYESLYNAKTHFTGNNNSKKKKKSSKQRKQSRYSAGNMKNGATPYILVHDLPNWKDKLQILMCQKFSQTNLVVAKRETEATKLSSAFIYLKFSLLGLAKTSMLVNLHKIDCESEFVNCLLCIYHYLFTLSGDIFQGIANNGQLYKGIIKKINSKKFSSSDISLLRQSYCPWILELPDEYDKMKLVELSIKSHRAALAYSSTTELTRQVLLKRLANALNIISSHYSENIVDCQSVIDAEAIQAECQAYLEEGISIFELVDDPCNIAMMKGNYASVYRKTGFYYSLNRHHSVNYHKELHCYKKALTLYHEALEVLDAGGLRDDRKLWESFEWQICSVNFKIGSILQDNCRIDSYIDFSFTNDMMDKFKSAMAFCSTASLSKQDAEVNELRYAIINRRLGDVYYNILVNSYITGKKRKEMFGCAQDCYQAANEIYYKYRHYQEFLRVTYQEVCLLDSKLQDLDEEGKESTLKNMLNLVMGSSFNLIAEDEENSRSKSNTEADSALSTYACQYPDFPKNGDPPLLRTTGALWSEIRDVFIKCLFEKYLSVLKQLVQISKRKGDSMNVNQFERDKKLYSNALEYSAGRVSSSFAVFLVEQWQYYFSRPDAIESK